jgi:hypothetical protein
VITKVASCAQPYGPPASELGHGTCSPPRIPRQADEGSQRRPRCSIRPKPRRSARPEGRQALQHGAVPHPSQQRLWCCQPRLKAMAMPEASSTAIIIAGGCASRRSSQRRCLAWPCRCGNVLGCALRGPSPPRVLRELGRGEMYFRCHTRGQAFGIGSSVMASPPLEIKPKPDWAQHTAHRTRSRRH